MDGLSGASAVFAVASVAIQLAETIQKLHVFWRTVQDAPSDITELFNELESLHGILVRLNPSSNEENLDTSSKLVLKDCKAKVLSLQQHLCSPLSDFKSNSSPRRKWAALKITLKKSLIESTRASIEKAKSTLVLSRVASIQKQIENQSNILLELTREIKFQNRSINIESSISNTAVIMQIDEFPPDVLDGKQEYASCCSTTGCLPISQDHCQRRKRSNSPSKFLESCDNIDAYPAQPPSHNPRADVTERHEVFTSSVFQLTTPLLSIRARSSTTNVTKRANSRAIVQKESAYVFYPNKLLRMLGLSYGIFFESKSISGWQFSLQPFNIVPSNSPIFEFCRNGNLAAIQTLLDGNHASLRDRDPDGRTPLWAAAKFLQHDVAKFLLDQGANPQVCDWDSDCSPFLAVRNSTEVSIARKLSMVDLLQSNSSDAYDDATISQLAVRLLMFYRETKYLSGFSLADKHDAALRILKQLLPLLASGNEWQTKVLEDEIRLGFHGAPLHWTLKHIRGMLYEADNLGLLHWGIVGGLLNRDPVSIRLIVEKTSDLHRLWEFYLYGTMNGTPTELALYQRHMFDAWRRILKETGCDVAKFVRKELVSSRLKEQGWTEETLGHLFGCTFESSSRVRRRDWLDCERCGRSGFKKRPLVELEWRRQLREIRLGLHSVSGIKEISLNFNEEFGNPLSRQETTKSIAPPPYQTSLPYNMVCSDMCDDDICVAWVYEGDSIDEPEFLGFESKDMDVEVVEVFDEEEEKKEFKVKMPGSFD